MLHMLPRYWHIQQVDYSVYILPNLALREYLFAPPLIAIRRWLEALADSTKDRGVL